MLLSVVMATNNSALLIKEALESVKELYDELIVGDRCSKDGTIGIVRSYGGKIVCQDNDNLGKRKQELVMKARGKWIIVFDTDERISDRLRNEIKTIIESKDPKKIQGYRIPYQNYFFGRKIFWGGENYGKIRLFRNQSGSIKQIPVHEEIVVRGGRIGKLKGVIHHYSYRTPWQVVNKFTRYAWITSGMLAKKGEAVTLKKLFFYGPHMVWARLIKEQGYRDGWRGLVLALMFGYMEGLTYWLLLGRRVYTRSGLPKS